MSVTSHRMSYSLASFRRRLPRWAMALAVTFAAAGCQTSQPAPGAKPRAASPVAVSVPRSRLGAEEASKRYPIQWRPPAVVQYAANGAVRPLVQVQGNLRISDPDLFVGVSKTVVTNAEDASGQAVSLDSAAGEPAAFSTALMQQMFATTGAVPVEVRLPAQASGYRAVRGRVDALVVEEGKITEFAAGLPADWTPVAERTWVRVTGWARERDGGTRVTFGIRLPADAQLDWAGDLKSLRLPWVIATELIRADGKAQRPTARACAGGGIGNDLNELSGSMVFAPPEDWQPGDGASAYPVSLRVRVATKVRIDEVPFELRDVAAN